MSTYSTVYTVSQYHSTTATGVSTGVGGGVTGTGERNERSACYRIHKLIIYYILYILYIILFFVLVYYMMMMISLCI